MGVPNHVLVWISSFLSSRSVVKGAMSESMHSYTIRSSTRVSPWPSAFCLIYINGITSSYPDLKLYQNCFVSRQPSATSPDFSAGGFYHSSEGHYGN